MRLWKCGGVRLRKLGEVVSKTLECEGSAGWTRAFALLD
jgi:hypothetical protein